MAKTANQRRESLLRRSTCARGFGEVDSITKSTKDTKAGNNFSFVNFVSFVVNCLNGRDNTWTRSALFKCDVARIRKEFRPGRSISFATPLKKARDCLSAELFRSQYFLPDRRPQKTSNWPKKFPDHRHLAGGVGGELGVAIVGRFSRNAGQRLSQHRRIIDAERKISRKYRKMQHPGRSVVSREILFPPGDLRFSGVGNKARQDRCLRLLDQWYPEAARLTALRGAEIIFYPTAIAGIRARKKNWRGANIRPGKIIQRSHATRTAVTLRRRTGSVT